MTDLRETVARALVIAKFGPEASMLFDPVPDDYPKSVDAQAAFTKRTNEARVEADAALKAIEDAGYWLAPLEPTHVIVKAMAESKAVDDEGEFPYMIDILDFSGENKAHTVLKVAYQAARDAHMKEDK